MAHDAFISYASRDKPAADAVCTALEGRGIRCWIAPRDVPPGIPFGQSIIEAIHGSRLLVLIFSAAANDSQHVMREVERAVGRRIPILPLRIEEMQPSGAMEYFLQSIHWLDALTPPLEEHLRALAEAANELLARGQEGRVGVPAEAEGAGSWAAGTSERLCRNRRPMSRYILGRALQSLGLLVMLFGIASELAGKIGLGQSLLIAAAGVVVYYLGVLLQPLP